MGGEPERGERRPYETIFPDDTGHDRAVQMRRAADAGSAKVRCRGFVPLRRACTRITCPAGIVRKASARNQ